MFLANHGVIVVGPSIAEAFDLMYYLERACRLQVLARSMGESCARCGPRWCARPTGCCSPTPRSTPVRTSARSSAFSTARSRTILGELVQVRPATPDDIGEIHAIYAHHVLKGLASFEEEPPSAPELRRRYDEVTGHGLPYLVADFGGRVAGYGYCTLYRTRSAYRYSLEDSVYIRPDAQGRGIGSTLLAELVAALRSARLPPDDRGDRRQRERRVDRPARKRRVPARRHAALGRLQVRPLGR